MQLTTRLAQAAEWTALLEASERDYALSQTFEFGAALGRAYPEYTHEPLLVEFDDNVRVLLPLIRFCGRARFLRSYEAMPLSLNGTPVAVGAGASARHIELAIQSLRADSLQISGGCLDSPRATLEVEGLAATEFHTHALSLDGDFERVWTERFSGKVRNQCRMAERKGVEVSTAATIAEFEVYHAVYVESTRRWGYAAPPYPPALFRELGALANRGVELKLARVEGEVVAGILLFHGRRSTFYWSAAMLKEHSAFCPNNALLHAAIREACLRGVKLFDFGASGHMDSVQKYKESFGAVPHAYHNYKLTTPLYRVTMSARRRLSRVPVA